MLEQGYIIDGFHFCIADKVHKLPDRFGCVPSPSQTAESWHPGIVPATHISFLHKLKKLPFAHHGISEVQPVEFNLPRPVTGCFQLIDEPVVKRTVHLELQRTEGMGYTLEIIALSMSEIIHRVNIPLGSCAVMRDLYYPVYDGVAHMHVG